MNPVNEYINHFKIMLLAIILFVVLPLNGQTDSDKSFPQFLYPEFTMSSVKMKDGKIQTTVLNYNILSENMVVENNNKLFDMANLDLIDTVFIQDSKFVPADDIFYEVLLSAPISLFVQHKGKLMLPGTPSGYGGTSQVAGTKQMSYYNNTAGFYNLEIPPDYSVSSNPAYWIRTDSKMYTFLNQRQFLKIFPDIEDELKQFIKQKRIKFDTISDLVQLVEHCNMLNQ